MGAVAQLKLLSDTELERLRRAPQEIEDLLVPEDVDDPFAGQTDLDKAWHGLHYLLTGRIAPDGTARGDAVLGGVELGPDLGYGRARLLEADRVQQIHAALGALRFDDLFQAANIDSPLLEQVYGGQSLADEKDYLRHHFAHLQDFYERAATAGGAILIYLA
jgi:hypothetical protein